MTLSSSKNIAIWIALCAATVLSAFTSTSETRFDLDAATLGVVVLGLAFVKVYMVIHWFMELENAPLAWRATFAAWCIIVFSILSFLLIPYSP